MGHDWDTVFARCVALDANEVLNERQIGWSGRWSLMGDFVICTRCISAQAIDQAHQPFQHSPDCVAREWVLSSGVMLVGSLQGLSFVRELVGL